METVAVVVVRSEEKALEIEGSKLQRPSRRGEMEEGEGRRGGGGG